MMTTKLWQAIHEDPWVKMVAAESDTKIVGIDVTAPYRLYLQHEKDVWKYTEDFPNVAPPFKLFFMWGKRPQFAKFGDEVVELAPGEDGLVFCALRKEDNSGWNMLARVCGTLKEGWQWEPGIIVYAVNQEGLFEFGGDAPSLMYPSNFDANAPWMRNSTRGEAIIGMVKPFLLATSFMHCKNVYATKITITADRQKALKRRGENPIYSYSILDITPMAKTMAKEAAGEASLSKALHICRGHFKDYRDGRGLFGKFKGTYWWDQAVRGSAAAGVREKEYRIK